MTTIAFCLKSGEVSTDSRACSGDTRVSDNANKYMEHEGHQFFFTGQVANWKDFCVAFVSEDAKCQKGVDISALVWDGRVMWQAYTTEEGTMCRLKALHDGGRSAIGSGRDFALAILDAGGSTADAIRAAKKRDTGTGGKVRTYQLRNGK